MAEADSTHDAAPTWVRYYVFTPYIDDRRGTQSSYYPLTRPFVEKAEAAAALVELKERYPHAFLGESRAYVDDPPPLPRRTLPMPDPARCRPGPSRNG